MKSAVLPKSNNLWRTPKKGSRLRASVRRLSPNASYLKFYPDLPDCEKSIWAVFRDGQYGVVKYIGGCTFKEIGIELYLNMFPIAWMYL